MSSVKRGFIWADKTVFYHKKEVHFGLKSQCFIAKKGSFWAEKSVFCGKKRCHFQTEEKGWVPFFSVSEGARLRIPTLQVHGILFTNNSKKGSFWAEKSVFCHKKGCHFQTEEQGWVPFFQWVREPGSVSLPCRYMAYCLLINYKHNSQVSCLKRKPIK